MAKDTDERTDIEIPFPEADVGDDALAREEAEAFATRSSPPELDEQVRRRTLLRWQGLEDMIARCVKGLLVVVSVLLASAVSVWVLHLLLPSRLRWLVQEDVEALQTILLSGALSALATAAAIRARRKPDE